MNTISEKHENYNIIPVIDKLGSNGSQPERDYRPRRCRGLIFSPDGKKILGIKRIKADRDPYVVFPGGGLEDTDKTAVDGLWRELREELDIGPEEVVLTGRALEHDGELFFIAVAMKEFEDLKIGGPEKEKDPAVAGQYLPDWFAVSSLGHENVFPPEITSLIIAASH